MLKHFFTFQIMLLLSTFSHLFFGVYLKQIIVNKMNIDIRLYLICSLNRYNNVNWNIIQNILNLFFQEYVTGHWRFNKSFPPLLFSSRLTPTYVLSMLSKKKSHDIESCVNYRKKIIFFIFYQYDHRTL